MKITMDKVLEFVLKDKALTTYKVGCDKVNYRILRMIPCTTKEIGKKLGLSKMPLYRRINILSDAALINHTKYEGSLQATPLTEAFLAHIEGMKEDILNCLYKMVKF